MLTGELIKIELTQEQAALFVLFQGHYDKIGYLIGQGAFDMKRGSIIINYSNEGEISSIEKREYHYPHPKKEEI